MKKVIIWIFALFLLVSSLSAYATTSSIILQHPGNNTGDCRVIVGGASDCYATYFCVEDEGSYKQRGYMQFNTTLIPGGSTINEAYWYGYTMSAETTLNLGVYAVYNTTWGESTITGTNQPCGSNFDDSVNCNLTYESTNSVGTTGIWYRWNTTKMVQNSVNAGRKNISMVLRDWSMTGAGWQECFFAREYTTDTTKRNYLNVTYTYAEADTTPPETTNYTLSTPDGNCTNWDTNKSNPCTTDDTTPTVNITTNEPAWCAIGVHDINFSDYNNLGVNRNCTLGQGTQSHTCTLITADESVYDTSYIYISCEDANKNQNITSTSGPLKLSVTGLEATGRTSIGIGIQNALQNSYTNYTDLQIYARNLSNGQVRGTFDRAAKKGNKMWAFNRIGVSDSYVNMFNLTPVLYTLELANKTSSNITLQVEQLINATK